MSAVPDFSIGSMSETAPDGGDGAERVVDPIARRIRVSLPANCLFLAVLCLEDRQAAKPIAFSSIATFRFPEVFRAKVNCEHLALRLLTNSSNPSLTRISKRWIIFC